MFLNPLTMVWGEGVTIRMICFLRLPVLHVFGLLLILECIVSLELLELRVPAHVPLGTRAQLSCRWQLGPADVLYSVKWYKDGKEFFRHVPRDVEPRRKFPLPGVDVEDADSSGSNITLTPAVLTTGGRYRCEVSGERPLFPTVSDHGDMAVIVLPEEGPTISGFRSRYRAGDRVQVTCTSGRSKPATQLAWYINGEPAPSAAVLPASYEVLDALERTSLQLDFEVTDLYFRKGGLKVKCLATITPIYWRSNEECALQERTINDKLAIRSFEELDSRADRVLSNPAPILSSSKLRSTLLVICAPSLLLCLH